MDVSDIFLAVSPPANCRLPSAGSWNRSHVDQFAKCVNYVNEDASAPVFAVFVCVWT
jgi:hypothetical protein